MPNARRRLLNFAALRQLVVGSLFIAALGLTSIHGEDQRPSEKSFPTGSGKFEVDVEGTRFVVYSYKPPNYKDGPLILVFHGVNRNADDYRDNAIKLADRIGALVAAPLFDSDRFPSRMYQRGGLVTKEGKALPKSQWTWTYVPKLADRIRKLAGRPDMPYYLIGHSGGGQFLERLAGFVATGAQRIVAANPGSYVFPSADMAYPYGFGGLPGELAGDEGLKKYLAQPLTIYLGTADNKSDENLDESEQANAQGKTRFERGQNTFRAAEKLAKAKGWAFNWRLTQADGIGHDAKLMFSNAACDTALFGEKRAAKQR